MLPRFSGRSAFLVHASLGLSLFVYMISSGAEVTGQGSESRLLQVSDNVEAAVLKEQLDKAQRISVMFSSAFFFIMSVWLMSHQTELNFGLVQRSALGKRLDFCMTLSLYISFFSSLFNAIQLMDDDNVVLQTLEGESIVLDLGRPIEWMLTCPLMQLAIPILGGEKIPDGRRLSMPAASFTILVLGTLSTFTTDMALKSLLFASGVLVFILMCSLMNQCIVDASSGGENLLQGGTFLRSLCIIIIVTWFPFPIWYALSPEGFNIITDVAGMKVAVAFLNVLSKGAFMMYVARIRTDHHTRQKTLIAVGYFGEDGEVELGERNGDSVNDPNRLGKITRMLIKDVLESMGRLNDFDSVVCIMESHLITSNDDILALTAEYCREISLPWGFVKACKTKIRQFKVQSGDGWGVKTASGSGRTPSISVSAPHISRNKDKITRVIASQQQGASDPQSLDNVDANSDGGLSGVSFGPTSPRSPRTIEATSATSIDIDRLSYKPQKNDDMITITKADLKELMDKLAANESRVDARINESKEFVINSMDKVMDVFEKRMRDMDGRSK
jgi:bacteriorhodopsin